MTTRELSSSYSSVLASGGKGCWQKVGLLAKEGIRKEKEKWGREISLPHFIKSFSALVGEFTK